VKITSNGCEPATLEVAPGPAKFEVTNDGADSITEYELVQDGRILGESENLTPGLDGSFTVTLKPGIYESVCPGGKSGTITVSGS
jgi:iron uptake system component EfeO